MPGGGARRRGGGLFASKRLTVRSTMLPPLPALATARERPWCSVGIEHVDRFPSEGSNWLEVRHSGTSAACRKGEEKKESLSERKEWKLCSAQFRQDDRNEGKPSLDSNLDGSLALRLQGLQGPHAVPAGRRAYQAPPQQEDDPSALRAENRKRARACERERERERREDTSEQRSN